MKSVKEVREKLISLAEPEYAEFVAKGAPSDYPVLGVRIPQIQKIAEEILAEDKTIYKFDGYMSVVSGYVGSGSSGKIIEELSIKAKSREEICLLVILLAEKINRLYRECRKNNQNPKIIIQKSYSSFVNQLAFYVLTWLGTWETIDLFCLRLKCVKEDREGWLKIIDGILDTGTASEFFQAETDMLREAFCRTGIVLLLNYYVEPEYIQVVFERILRVKDRDEYYIKMAVAWLIQKCFVKFPDLTYAFMKSSNIPKWTLRKAVSKIQDSRQIEPEWKEYAKELVKK